jgi:hypothetical protein
MDNQKIKKFVLGTRKQVIDESLRHIQHLCHRRRELCIYCIDDDSIPPNPWDNISVCINTASHSKHDRKRNLCAICYPILNKKIPIHGAYND